MSEAYFTTADGAWFSPTDLCRGPWDPSACHAGPPTGLLARASERMVPGQRLTRIAVELTRPVPHAGFRVEGEIVRAGRTVSVTTLRLVDGDERTVVTARGLHIVAGVTGDPPSPAPGTPRLEAAAPGVFGINRHESDRPMFSDSLEVRYPAGEDRAPGPTTLWMRTVPLLAVEPPTPFQAICPLADCGNAISRNAEPEDWSFVNADLTIALHRAPVGEWFGSQAISHWHGDGVGLADALLFDDEGPVGRALQMLVLRPS
jgi:hypothetical protein